ncbi:hypothetical protein [Roseimaritima sediminicola]|uniref:hypothetical protein n=1 Tax=Roseimaritima sediminicola TaxID=2662066 RepID=UPI0012982CE8|nr:hypothetical protein [Roseimaritima sediminicola]
MKPAPKCTLVPESKPYAKTVIRTVRFDEPDLIIELQGDDFSYLRLIFRNVVAFRVIDEREITEFWNAYSATSGWLWEVAEGGYLALERQRESFNVLGLSLREHFVVCNYCVSVLSCHSPEFVSLGCSPPNTLNRGATG